MTPATRFSDNPRSLSSQLFALEPSFYTTVSQAEISFIIDLKTYSSFGYSLYKEILSKTKCFLSGSTL